MDKPGCSGISRNRKIACAPTSDQINLSSPAFTMFTCDLCNSSFQTLELAKLHIEQVHYTGQNVAGKTINNQKKEEMELKRKKEEERKEPPETNDDDRCHGFTPAHLKIIKMLRGFLNSVSFAVGRKSFCKLCDFTTDSLEKLNNHIRAKHNHVAFPFAWANNVLRLLPWELIYNCDLESVECHCAKKEYNHQNDHHSPLAVTPNKHQKYRSNKSQNLEKPTDNFVSASELTLDQGIVNNSDVGIPTVEVLSLSQPIAISLDTPDSNTNNEFQCVNNETCTETIPDHEYCNNFSKKSDSDVAQRSDQNQSEPLNENCTAVCDTLDSLEVPKNHDAFVPGLKQKSVGKQRSKKRRSCDTFRQSVKQKSSNGKGGSSKKGKKTVDDNNGPKVTCNICMISVFKRYWKKHNEIWHSRKRFKCHLCLKRFRRKKDWVASMKMEGYVSEDSFCRQCLKELMNLKENERKLNVLTGRRSDPSSSSK